MDYAMKTLLLVIYLYVLCGSAERNLQDMKEPNSKMLTNFRNFETCVDNFDIHRDKIIRTEDSRALGAKYISETDMDTREECLRLCCVTDTCDVFVFEEKSPGSCYLFHCGSSANFKCKFTKHHNYTSGVLTVSKEMGDEHERDSPSKHEQELNQLRKPEGASAMNLNSTLVPASNSQPFLQDTSDKLNKTLDQSPFGIPACSRFQFKCRTSGDCIAIYNACDGIPQCSDGSDESECPAKVTSSLFPVVVSAGNRTDQDGFRQQPGNSYNLRSQKASITDASDSTDRDRTTINRQVQSVHDETHNHRNEVPVSVTNILEQHEVNLKSRTNEFKDVYHENHFKNLGDSSQGNLSPEFSGFRQFSNLHAEQDIGKLDNDVHNYITPKTVPNPNRIAERYRYKQNSRNVNLNRHINSGFIQQQPDLTERKGNEEMTVPENTKETSKLHPPSPIEFKHGQPELTSGFRNQITNTHLSEMERNEYQNEHRNPKGTISPLLNRVISSSVQHTSRLVPQEINIDKNDNDNERLIEIRKEQQLENGIKEQQLQLPSFQETQLQNAPSRSYKFKVSKVTKNTPQPFDADSGYPLSSDYIYDDGQRPNWNAVSLVPHSPDTSHRLSTSSVSSIQMIKSLKRPDIVEQIDDYRLHLHDTRVSLPDSNKIRSNASHQVRSQELSTKSVSSINDKMGRYLKANAPITSASEIADEKLTPVRKNHPEHFVSLQQADVSQPSNEKLQDRPSGALLSTSFGLCITFAMIVLVACRLRVVKRRLRRNGKSLYAHDADYLVNGMYL